MNGIGIAEAVLLSVFLGATLPSIAQTSSADQLKASSLEDLTQMQISVSSFARRSEDLEKTPAAVYVITSEQIEHSAAASIPDLLRMVPGVQVAQINAYTWAVTARGFNNQFADRLLVLLDGRTIYSEIFYGVNWDEIDIPLSTIDRIEVVRGPGAAVWGTNAVNGVVNIITKPVRHTIGTSVTSQASNLLQETTIHYAGALTERSQFSLDLTGNHRRALVDSDGVQAFDGQHAQRLGGHIDWQPNLRDTVSISGDLYRETQHADLLQPLASSSSQFYSQALSGGFILSRWERKAATSELVFQAYYDRQVLFELNNHGVTQTGDLDVQNHFHAGAKNDIVFGGELRLGSNQFNGSPRVTLLPVYNTYLVASFAQDEITLVPNKLFATVGTKVQDGTLAGFQAQPSVRLLWAPVTGQSLWAAASHAAVDTPVAEIGLDLDEIVGTSNGLPVVSLLDGNPAIKPEFVDAYEAGYRTHLRHDLSLDFAAFYNVNSRLIGTISGTPQPGMQYGPDVEVPTTYVNGYSARSAGLEAAMSWKPSRHLDLAGSYTWMQAHGKQTTAGDLQINNSWSSPRNSGSLSASWALPRGWRANSFLQYVEKLTDTSPSFHGSTPGQEIGGYARLDLHLSHSLGRHLDLDAGGTNLLSPRHLEFGDNSGLNTCLEVPRSLYVKAKVSF
ncbi:iron complex outermembrane recepter protein [Bryocella elongata]|uniref:Iron complex outermembrane recepter protein n=1 Tax=Bryocella elongata TaxID=863522 RepID=A0A1H5ZK54_9BACT|nr:TonB-dependent receptor [Bryocella elongata]SEG36908.1 iron complex outermembrane recepter protein [Bryocella elongata]